MLAMPGMDKSAWQFLGRTIMGGTFPALESLLATATQGEAIADAAEPAKLAVAAICAGRAATKAAKAAVEALGTVHTAGKKTNKKAKTV